jgi:hypothetical protein
MAVLGTRLGALDFLEKPLSPEKLPVMAENTLKLSRLETENRDLRARIVVVPRVEECRSSEGGIRLRMEVRYDFDEITLEDARKETLPVLASRTFALRLVGLVALLASIGTSMEGERRELRWLRCRARTI